MWHSRRALRRSGFTIWWRRAPSASSSAIHGGERRGNKNDRLDADRLSERLRLGSLNLLTLKELVRNYNNLVTRVMQRIKALFRARAILTPGVSVYRVSQREQWLSRLHGGARVRAGSLLAQLDVLLELRPKAKAAMIVEARRQPAWKILRSIPFLVPSAWPRCWPSSEHRFDFGPSAICGA